MRNKLFWTLMLTVLFVCLATACSTSGRWEQCQAASASTTEPGDGL